MEDIKLTQESKVIVLFGDLTIFPRERTIGWYLEQIGKSFGNDRIIGDWYYSWEYTQLWEAKVVIYAIISWLTYILEYDDLFYTLQDNTIYINKLGIKEQVR